MRRWALVAFALVAAAGIGVAAAQWARSSGSDAPAFRGSVPPAGIELPRFALRDHAGRLVQSSALRGNVVLVTFLETRCREACPVIANQIGAGLDRLSAGDRERTVAIAISVHPKDDTAASVRRFLRQHRVEGRLRYLIGSEGQLRPVWRAFLVVAAFDTGNADVHSAPVRVYDPRGVWVSTLNSGADLTPANLAHDVRAALRSDG